MNSAPRATAAASVSAGGAVCRGACARVMCGRCRQSAGRHACVCTLSCAAPATGAGRILTFRGARARVTFDIHFSSRHRTSPPHSYLDRREPLYLQHSTSPAETNGEPSEG
jgi:hypothetical protein